MPDDDDRPGLFGRGKDAWVGIVEAGHEAIAGKINDHKAAHVAGLGEQIEADLGPMVAHAIGEIANHPDTPDTLRPLLAELTKPQNFTTALLVGVAVGSIVSPVIGAATAPAVQALANTAWHGAATTPGNPGVIHMSALEAATAVLKGVLTEPQGRTLAAYNGMSGTDFDTLVQVAGQSIGIAEALLLWRRGQIDDAHLTEIIRYSNVNPKFYADIPKLQYLPPTVGEVITGWLKGHLTEAEARPMLAHTGMDPANAQWLHDSAGRPPGIEQMLHLWNRGHATEADVDAAVRQSDINDHYLPFVKFTRFWYPPPRSIMAMLRDGAIDDTRARQLFTDAGVPPDVQADMLAEAHHTKSGALKDLTQAQVVRMYVARFIDRAEAVTRLQTLRYTPADVTLLLDFADDARHEQQLNAAIRKVGTLYVAHKLARTDAAAALNTAGLAVAAQHDLLALWDIERDANVAVPSIAGVVGAYRRGLITGAGARTRLTELGVQGDDMAIFVGDGFPPTAPADARLAAQLVHAGDGQLWTTQSGGTPTASKHETVAQIQHLYTAGTITRAQAITRLVALGYSEHDAGDLITLAKPPTPTP